MDGLTEKQRRFVEEYLIDLNATQAAIRAGYSEATAGTQGYQLLQKTTIQNAIEQAKADRRERSRMKADDIIFELEKIAQSDIRKLYENGRLKRLDDMTLEDAQLINELSMTEFGPKVKLYDRMKALDMLMKHHDLYAKSEPEDKRDDGLKALAEAIKESQEAASEGE